MLLRCREVFLLSRDHQLSYDEIATALGISRNTVRLQLVRALRELRDGLPEISTE